MAERPLATYAGRLRSRRANDAGDGQQADRRGDAGRPAGMDRHARVRHAGAGEPRPEDRRRQIAAELRQRTGYLRLKVGAALRVLPVKNVLAERILEEADVVRLIVLEPDKRNHAILRLGYIAGLRISEICGLRWRDTK